MSRLAALRNKSQSDSLTCAVPTWPLFALDARALGRKGKARADYFGDFTGGRAGPDRASAPAVYEQDFFPCSIGFRPG